MRPWIKSQDSFLWNIGIMHFLKYYDHNSQWPNEVMTAEPPNTATLNTASHLKEKWPWAVLVGGSTDHMALQKVLSLQSLVLLSRSYILTF